MSEEGWYLVRSLVVLLAVVGDTVLITFLVSLVKPLERMKSRNKKSSSAHQANSSMPVSPSTGLREKKSS